MNIAEILKYCPKGTKLYSPIYGDVTLDKVCHNNLIKVIINNNNSRGFYKDGSYYEYGECVLFPSKDQRDWKEFRLPVKRGDIMMFNNRAFIISNEYAVAFNNAFHKYICGIDTDNTFKVSQSDNYWTSAFYIPASEEAKKELFDKMAEAGYRWNADTLELEKIEPKFKEGDVVIDKNNNLHLVSSIDCGFIYTKITLYANGKLDINNNLTGYFNSTVTLASKEEKNKLLSILVKEGYKYDKEGHKLVKQEFKPFDKVLVRRKYDNVWMPKLYARFKEHSVFPYICVDGYEGIQCIPYEGNEYLLGTTDFPTCTDKKE